jgi:hypothetical protein
MDPEAAWQDGRLAIRSGIAFEPSSEMREALTRGVRLRLEVATRVSRRFGPIALESESRRYPIEISYLPLTEEWRIEATDSSERYPRLWLLLDALAAPRSFDTGLESDALGLQAWQVQVRVRFDRDVLPPPMHLPALLSPQWRLKSEWHTWQFDAS